MDKVTKRSVFHCQNDDGNPCLNKEQIIEVSTSNKTWKFSVTASGLQRGERVCITGDCEQLGNWKSDNIIILNLEDQLKDLHSITLNVPADRSVQYRYCACLIENKENKSVLVTRWETHLEPRKINIDCLAQSKEPDLFGYYNGVNKLDQGWISNGSLVQFKFFKEPFQFYNDTNKNIFVKITPVDSGYNSCDYDIMDSEISKITQSDNTITQVAVLNNENCTFKDQSHNGMNYKDNEFLIFNIFTCSINTKMMYIVDFYSKDSDDTSDIALNHIGRSYLMPDDLKSSEGELKLPIICPNKHRPMGMVHGEYLIVRPTDGLICDMEKSYMNYWKQSWIGLDVGHRGNGASFKEDRNIVRENTIASSNKAMEHGADMVEFDVQLSKDLIPVIYHDFDVCLALKNKHNVPTNEVFQFPLKDLTFDQLQSSKLYHVGEDPDNQRFNDESLVDNQPFPLLSDYFDKININLGFNIEIKWPMKDETGHLPLKNSIDMNKYIDEILKVVFRHCGKRKIFFSCFNPEVCVMLSLKQNLYAVMFLTQGITNKWEKLYDPRCNTIQYAIFNALNSKLLGIVVHTEDLLRDPSQVILARDAGLILFCWGEDNNNKETIKKLKELGLHGVIFDRMDQYSEKEIKDSIFLREDKQNLSKVNVIDPKDDVCD